MDWPYVDPAAAEEREALVRDVGARGRFQDVARARAPEAERAPRGGHIVECSGAVRGQMVLEPLPVARPVHAAGDDAEDAVVEPHDGQVGLEAAVLVED